MVAKEIPVEEVKFSSKTIRTRGFALSHSSESTENLLFGHWFDQRLAVIAVKRR